MFNRLKNLSPLLGATLLRLSLHYLSAGLSLNSLLSLLSGLSESILGNALASVESKTVRQLLRGIRVEDLGHNLGELLYLSIEEALDYTLLAYQAEVANKTKQRQAKKRILEVKKAIRKHDSLNLKAKQDKEVYVLLQQGVQDLATNQVLDTLLEDLIPEEELRHFVVQEYPRYIQLCFAERLQSPHHREAWAAYQRLMFEDFGRLLQGIRQEQVQLPQGLKHPLSDERVWVRKEDFSEALSTEIQLRLRELKAEQSKLLQLSGSTHRILQDLKQRLLLDIHRTHLWQRVCGLASLFILLGLGFSVYRQMVSPFSMTVQLIGWQGEGHKPLRGEGIVLLQIGGRSYRASVNQDAEAIFTDLPHELEGKLARVYLSSNSTTPYYSRDSLLRLTAQRTQKLYIAIEGLALARGLVLDSESLEPIPEADVYIQGIHSRCNRFGTFTCSIPHSLQSKEQEFRVSKTGYRSYRAQHSMIGAGEFHFLLERQSE